MDNQFLDSDEENQIIVLLKPLISQNLDGRILTEWLKEVYDEVRIMLKVAVDVAAYKLNEYKINYLP